jgi:hypothetical protein
MTDIQFCADEEIDNAIRAVLCATFCAEDAEELRRVVRLRLPSVVTPEQIVDAVCAELRWRGRLELEEQRRRQALQVLAAFFDLPISERESFSLMAVV